MYRKRLPALIVYLGGFLIGLNLVSFPASSTYLISTLQLSDQQYGSIFLPQLLAALGGALLASFAVQHLRLRVMFLIAVGCFALSELSLATSMWVRTDDALHFVMLATALFGFGFGFGGGPLNGIASMLSVKHSNAALTALHVAAGLGLMLGPVYFNYLVDGERWIQAPLSLCILAVTLLGISLVASLPEPTIKQAGGSTKTAANSLRFWLIMIIAILYALAEGTFSNWAVVYVEEKGFSNLTAAASLSAFWAALTVGRVLAALAVSRIAPFTIWMVLPILMGAALCLLPLTSSNQQAILAFPFAGLACSAFFPLMVIVASEPHPDAVSWVASMLTAALMLGVGIGSYVIGTLKAQISIDTLYLVSAAYPLLALLLMFFIKTRLPCASAR